MREETPKKSTQREERYKGSAYRRAENEGGFVHFSIPLSIILTWQSCEVIKRKRH
jgi:hypothetical protein